MDKAPDAFRTISEVAEHLETPAHVLRFWESRFPQIRPVKRAGGRRYYRPADVALLTGIKRLLHEEGLTIRGVQKILREQGVRHVSGLTETTDDQDAEAALEAALAANFGTAEVESLPAAEVESAQIFALETALRRPAPVQPSLFAQVEAEDILPEAEAPTDFDLLAEEPVEAMGAPPFSPADEGDVWTIAPSVAEVAPEPETQSTLPEPAESSVAASVTAEDVFDLAARLRALPAGAFAARAAEGRVIRERLLALRERMTGPLHVSRL